MRSRTAFRFDALVLWRDGADAVVSLRVDGEWVRVAAAKAAGMFHVELGPAELRELDPFFWDGSRRRRKKKARA